MTHPGWYADNQDPSRLRWWDGAAWTSETRLLEPAAASIEELRRIAGEAVRKQATAQAPVAAPTQIEGWRAEPGYPGIVRWWAGGRSTRHVVSATNLPLPDPTISLAPPDHDDLVEEMEEAAEDEPAFAPRGTLDERARLTEARLALLRRELESVEEALEIQSFGFYRPKYGFQAASDYADKLSDVRLEQELLIKRDIATFCETPWRVDNSLAAGRRMIKQASKLMLRAFNGECDAAIGKAKYDNVVTLEQRIRKSFEAINKLGLSNRLSITQDYCALKLAELHLVHEHREKVQEEKEEEKRVRDEMREEEKAREDIERVKAAAEKDESAYARALAKARTELGEAAGKQHAKLESLIVRLEADLKDAIDRKAKAIARAQLTRSGHVYVLSNFGSFGEGVYKLGMTRRLEPLERVHELGDASVPFPFDVHAMIYSEDAPALENALHKEFGARRMNRVNLRREYFRVTLDEVRAAIEKHHALVTFVLTPEAEEWRKTQALLDAESRE